ncbi:MAG TPA: zinc-dependent alcohol dehydrogenase family protein [Syntrophorhabdaceae bacterium]|nr:zinc-dependent alcohol dehydrogenase family protein [Syntrophorhabdaceae bacterium]
MKAMVIEKVCDLRVEKQPLKFVQLPIPHVGDAEILVRVSSCGVCHTELDEIEGRTPPPKFPVIPGHQVVGRVERTGHKAARFKVGERVGVAWIFSACGVCEFCREGNENLCEKFTATGRDVNGGYAEYMNVPETYAFRIPEAFSDLEAPPLLCAGTIGYRSLRLTEMRDGENIGLVGFGASAHLVLQMVRYRYPASKIFVFARSAGERDFAMELGAHWAGDTTDVSPEKMHRIIDTTPAWGTIVHALKNLERGGRLVINAIRKEEADKKELLTLSYPEHLWLEKEIKSVANVASMDVSEFLELAAAIPIRPEVEAFALEEANRALIELKERKIRGAKVLKIA